VQQVNGVIIPSLGLDTGGQQISESTARRWLTKLGYELKEVKKGIYIDGHEREDVVAYWNKFLKEFAENERYLMILCCDCQLTDHRLRWTYHNDDLEPIEPNLGPGECLHVPIFHDESIFQANDLPRQVWVHDGRMPLRKKGQGRAIHVSDFIVEQSGRLTLSPAQIGENSRLLVGEQLRTTDVREIIYLGENHDGFWTNDKLVEQVSDFVHRYIKRSNLGSCFR
jgi:hypothetical protein